MAKQNKHVGSSLNELLREEDLLAETQAKAMARVVAWQLQQYKNEKELSNKALAEALDTSRSSLARLLDPANTSITLNSIAKVASLLGKRMELKFVS